MQGVTGSPWRDLLIRNGRRDAKRKDRARPLPLSGRTAFPSLPTPRIPKYCPARRAGPLGDAQSFVAPNRDDEPQTCKDSVVAPVLMRPPVPTLSAESGLLYTVR